MKCMRYDFKKNRCGRYIIDSCDGCKHEIGLKDWSIAEIDVWVYMFKKGCNNSDLNKQRKLIEDTVMLHTDSKTNLPELIKLAGDKPYNWSDNFVTWAYNTNKANNRDIMKAYKEDTSRGGGASSENNGSRENKALMNDNRDKDCKLTRTESAEISKATKEWEMQHGPLERISMRRP